MKVIGICGKIGAGKDTFADYLVRKHNFVKLTMSDIIKKEMESRGLDVANRFRFQQFSKEMKEEYGKDIWAKACVEYARKNHIRRVVISGLRDTAELNFFRTLGDDFRMVSIKAEQQIRFKRIKNRKSIKDVEIFADFIKQEVDEGRLFDLYNTCDEKADYRFDNSKMIIELYAFAEQLMKELNW